MSRDAFLNAESSGGLSGFEFTVDDAFFIVDEKYSEKVQKDTYFLHWVGRSNAEGHEIMGLDGFHPKWATDPDFTSLDGGKTIQSPTKGEKVGKAYSRMTGHAARATAHLADTPEDFLANASPLNAAVWVGHTWVMENVDTDFGGTIGSITELMPVKYLGTAAQTGVPTAGAGQQQQQLAAVPTPPPAQAPQAPAAPSNGGGDMRSQVVQLAQSHSDYRSFQAAALQLAGIANYSDLLASIAREDGIWAEVNG